jgi:hypothetical protein
VCSRSQRAKPRTAWPSPSGSRQRRSRSRFADESTRGGAAMRVWRYVITHDTGFAPNFEPPSATLVTCKPRIRKDAKLHDLIIAFNGYRLIRTEPHSVRWAGIVADVIPLAAYWRDPRFQGKKPPRHGGHRSGDVPDNIYRPTPEGNLEQVENTSHGPDEAATDIGGKNALILGRLGISARAWPCCRSASIYG